MRGHTSFFEKYGHSFYFPVPPIRATNLYRKEDGQWKMIGHHVDLLPQMAN